MKHDTENNKKKIIDALERSLGIVTPACKEVGISRDRFYHWYNNDPEFKRRVDDINEITLDFVENQLLKAIKNGDMKGITFYMRYKAKRRGYVETIDITSNGKQFEQPLFGPIKSSEEDVSKDDSNRQDPKTE